MKAVVFDRIGDPQAVLELRDMPMPVLKEGEALVRMVAASVNPGDLLFIQNRYPEPKRPVFPAQIGGNHGAGIIEKAGSGVQLKPGTLVAFSYYNTWAEYAAVPVEWLIPLPAEYPLAMAGQFLNLVTAWDLLNQVDLEPGQWLAQTGGNAAVSTLVSQFAQNKGIPVLSIVRRRQPAIDLEALGAEAVIELESGTDEISTRIQEITRGQGIHGLIDNIGGPLTGDLIRNLAFGGKVVINGGMTPERFELHNFDILMKGARIESHIYRYFFDPPKATDKDMLESIIAQNDIQIPIAGLHHLSDFKTAIARTIQESGNGKHFFVMDKKG
jgi:NADPH:quinone reductase-like Zn-dependent oxidoreductase